MKTAIFILIATTASANEIALKDVWAARMPGTRNIRELEPRTEGDHREFGPLMHGIYTMMQGGRSGKAWGRPDAGPGFPAPGTGIRPLNFAYDILVGKQDRPKTVPAGEVSLVFFARQSGQYCYLEKIEREGKVITLTYRFHVHRTGEVTGHLALIPLGTLDPGKYEVRTVQLPVARPFEDKTASKFLIEGERLKRTVSQPFSFEVK
jgi:hypothetical protein